MTTRTPRIGALVDIVRTSTEGLVRDPDRPGPDGKGERVDGRRTVTWSGYWRRRLDQGDVALVQLSGDDIRIGYYQGERMIFRLDAAADVAPPPGPGRRVTPASNPSE